MQLHYWDHFGLPVRATRWPMKTACFKFLNLKNSKIFKENFLEKKPFWSFQFFSSSAKLEGGNYAGSRPFGWTSAHSTTSGGVTNVLLIHSVSWFCILEASFFTERRGYSTQQVRASSAESYQLYNMRHLSYFCKFLQNRSIKAAYSWPNYLFVFDSDSPSSSNSIDWLKTSARIWYMERKSIIQHSNFFR